MPEQPRSIIAGAESDQADVVAATTAATEAFAAYRATTPEQRGAFLDAVADEIDSDKAAIVDAAVAESHLPEARIAGEVGRTTGQLRMFADVVRRGDHLGVRIDPALPDRDAAPAGRHPPAPHPARARSPSSGPATFRSPSRPPAATPPRRSPPDARSWSRATPPTPRTGFLVARAVTRAVEKQDQHAGTFSFLLGEGVELGQELVRDPTDQGGRFHRLPRRRPGPGAPPRPRDPSRSRCTPRCPRSTRSSSCRARSRPATSRHSPGPTSVRSPWAPASSARTLACSSCRPERPATRSWPQPADAVAEATGATMLTPGIADGVHRRAPPTLRDSRGRPGRGPGQRRWRGRTRAAARGVGRPRCPRDRRGVRRLRCRRPLRQRRRPGAAPGVPGGPAHRDRPRHRRRHR